MTFGRRDRPLSRYPAAMAANQAPKSTCLLSDVVV